MGFIAYKYQISTEYRAYKSNLSIPVEKRGAGV
jgi:hypothetical protein